MIAALRQESHHVETAPHVEPPRILRMPGVGEPPEPATAPTLRAVFEQHYKPKIALRASKTQEAYEDALAHWERYTDDPPVTEIDSNLLDELQQKLAKRQRRGQTVSPSTVDKTFRHLRPIIDLCMPRDRLNPRGLGLVDYLEYPGTLAKGDPKPKKFTSSELDRIYEACRVATWPKRKNSPFPAALLWRVAVVALYNLGPRVYDLFGRQWSDIEWLMRDDDDKVIHPYGSIGFRALKTKKLQRVPFSAVAHAHFLAIRRPKGRVFPGAWKYSNRSTVNKQWGKILEAAGVKGKPLEVFRKTCSTAADRVKPGTGEWICGHGAKGVNAKNYHDPTEDVFDAVLGMHQPPAFSAHVVSDLATRQPRLLGVESAQEFAWD